MRAGSGKGPMMQPPPFWKREQQAHPEDDALDVCARADCHQVYARTKGWRRFCSDRCKRIEEHRRNRVLKSGLLRPEAGTRRVCASRSCDQIFEVRLAHPTQAYHSPKCRRLEERRRRTKPRMAAGITKVKALVKAP